MSPAKSRRPVTRRPSPSARRRPPARSASAGLQSPVELGVVLFVLTVGAVFFWRASDDQFMLPRATFVVAAALLLLTTWITRGAQERRWPRVPRFIGVAGGAVLLLLTMSTFTAPIGWIAIVGPLGRSNGLALYLACGVLFVGALQLDEREWRVVANVLAILLGIVAAYGVLQWLGADPLSWPGAATGTIFSTFGQPNFAGGWVAVMLPFAILPAVDGARRLEVRAAAAAVIVLSLLFLPATRAFQGLPAVIAGLVPLGFVLTRRYVASNAEQGRRYVRLAIAALLVVVLAAVIVPATRTRIRSNIDSGLHEREMLWEAGGRMVSDAPILGQGVGAYGLLFHKFEPTRHAVEFSDLTADAPHSVPLEMAVDGGLLLALAYLAFIVLVGARLVGALRRSPSLLLASVGGAWLAYQVQAAVSFDVPPLATAHWILAGGIVALTTDASEVAKAAQDTWSRLGLAIGAALLVATSPWLTRPLRGDIAVHDGLGQLRAGQVEGVTTLERATRLAPWNSVAWADLASAYQVAQRPDDALAAGAEAIRRNPGSIRYRTSEAKLAAALGKQDLAARWFRDAISSQPRNPAVWLDAATWAQGADGRQADAVRWYLGTLRHSAGKASYVTPSARYLAAHGEASEAIGLTTRYAKDQPKDAQLQVVLGDVLRALGRRADARAAYERALGLAPGDAEAQLGLKELDKGAGS